MQNNSFDTSVELHNALLIAYREKYTHVILYLQDDDKFLINIVEEDNGDLIKKIKIEESLLSNLASDSSKAHSRKNSAENPLMAGVPVVSFEKHLSRIISEEKYTVVIIKQRGTPPNVSRVLEAIISPGTNFDFVLNS
ncbi:MAG: DNA mismatch repair protein, partial [Epsilonproteobacteria bacterium]